MNFNEIAAAIEDLSNRVDILEIRINTLERAAAAQKTALEGAEK